MSGFLQFLDIGAGDERPARADDDNGGDRWIALGCIQSGQDSLGHTRTERIYGRIVDRDYSDAARYRYSNHFTHVCLNVQPARMSLVKLTVPADAPNYPTILHALEDVARRTPDRQALICEDRSLTFAQHKSAISGFAKRLQKLGVEGERVAVLMTNCLEMPVCILGAMAAHAYVAPMNPNYSDSELTPLLKDTTPKVIVTLPEFYPRLSKFAAAMGIPHVLVAGEGSNTIASWISEGSEGLPQPLPHADDYAMMFFTGGTTGLPKGAEHRHRHIMAFCRLEAAFFSTLEYDKEISLSVAPMFHIFGHHHGVIHPLYIGSTHVIVRQYKPDIVLEQLSKYKVTLFAGGPSTVYVGILAAEGIKTADLSNLKICCAGSSPFSQDLLTNWEKTTGCPIYEGVGMSEGAPVCEQSGNWKA